jgi:hypothetical protein
VPQQPKQVHNGGMIELAALVLMFAHGSVESVQTLNETDTTSTLNENCVRWSSEKDNKFINDTFWTKFEHLSDIEQGIG